MSANERRLALVGAHPDDCDIVGAGLAMRYRELGWPVLFVSMTNGDAGYQSMTRQDLAARRKAETEAVAELLGIDYLVMENHDGELTPSLEQRWQLLRILRRFAPDLVVTHHQDDYHPDHRYTCRLVGDVSFLLKVPSCCPDAPVLRKDTVQAFFHAVRMSAPPNTFCVAIDTDDLWERKREIISCHESQIFEWLPWVNGEDPTRVPPASDKDGRRAFVDTAWEPVFMQTADLYRTRLKELYGPARGEAVLRAEAYFAAPYPTPLGEENYRDVMPFFG